ncbi:hypothetical protein HYU23_03300 [Candidatus Woesearchaeota archaeon]|nr:hypothetical protein [Candidatus Woesearchaeota archaeon]
MKKRGQVSVFVIIGVILIVIFSLIFLFKDKITETIRQEPTNPQEYLNQQLNNIKNEIGKCVSKETSEASQLLMQNGGEFEGYGSYINYYGVKYPILCREINNTNTCLSQPIIILDLQNKLDNYLPDKINKCVNLEEFKNKDYVLNLGKFIIKTEIFNDKILVNLDTKISLKKDNIIVESSNLLYDIKIPLGDLSIVANELIQIKASGGKISIVQYNKDKFNKYFIDVRRPYPDEVYKISLTNNPEFNFYFAIEGIGRFERPEGRIE